MVEPKLALLEMQIKSGLGQTSKLCKAHFSDAPKVFDTVNMRYFISEFIVSMLDSIMLFITQVYQTVIAFPAIGVDRAFKVHLLNRLLILFEGNPVYALASYNAGDHKAKEWIDIRGNMGVVEFIESIPYNETRNYVKKNLRNYSIYLSLYKGEDVSSLKDLLTRAHN